MDKDSQITDYVSFLADLEAKEAALHAAIVSFRAAIAAGALGAPGDVSPGSPSVGKPLATSGAVSLPRGAFLGKNATDAIRLYLGAVRRKQTNKEIAKALRDGGLESTGNFDNYVTHGLYRLKKEDVVLRFEDGWGLAEWYPESFKNRVAQDKPKKGKKKGKGNPAHKSKPVESSGKVQEMPKVSKAS